MTPFYKKALALFTRTQEAQIQKGLAKYPEPFNPHNWTPEELLNHALEETVDLTHYLVGLKELVDAKDKEIERLKTLIPKEYHNAPRGTRPPYMCPVVNGRFVPVINPKKSPYDINFNPHFDQDDQ